MKRFHALGAMAVILLAAGHPAGAVSVVVTDGFLEHNSNSDIWFELRSETHTISCTPQFCGDFSVPTSHAGSLPTGSIQTVPAQAFVRPGNEPLVVNGIAFPRPAGFTGNFGTFNLSVGPFSVPTSPSGSFPRAIVEAPFTFTGNLNAVNPEGSILDLSLTGQGLSRVAFDLSTQGFGFISDMSFSFTDSTGGGPGGGPAIPEPSTVLLVASGLAGLGLWRRASNKPHVG